MREKLSELITEYAVKNPKVVVLSGDHGYALFDSICRERPDQFVNVGVAEQGMIGIAAGLARTGYFPIAYGLSAFLPIRVLEQIKLDLCIAKLPVLLLGDGAGLVYSTLGSSHQCGEDIAALRPLPGITIYSPADEFELEATFREAMDRATGPTYLRIGKSDRPVVHSANIPSTEYVFTRKTGARALIVGTGSMSSTALQLASELATDAVSLIRLKPFPKKFVSELSAYDRIFVVEEHHEAGGVYSSIAENLLAEEAKGKTAPARRPIVHSISLRDQFAKQCGGHDFALSEHGLTNGQIRSRITEYL